MMREEIKDRKSERGSAMVIAILIMGLLSVFVAVALSRVTTETLIMGNESDEQKTIYAAQASLETMTRNFNKIFDVHLTPSDTDLADVKRKTPPGFTTFTFTQDIIKKGDSNTVNISGGTYQGLKALQDPWQIQTTATSSSGQQVMLTRDFLNNRVPIFQFGMFFDGDLEVASGSALSFGGRVHSNGNLYLRGGGRTTFDSRVSASGEVVIDKARNGWANDSTTYPSAAGFGENLYIKDGSGTDQQLKLGKGSVIGGPDIAKTDANVPDGDLSSLWKSAYPDRREDCTLITDIFGGNLVAKAKKLELPLKLGGGASNNIEMIKRGRLTNDFEKTVLSRTVDNQITAYSRFSNKPGIRVSLADSQGELPSGSGGVRIDGASTKPASGAWNSTDADGTRGYQPIAMKDGYVASRINGHRLYTGASYTDNGTGCPAAGCTANSMPANRETWMKVELITIDTTTLLPVAQDITSDFLSLGLTEPAPDGGDDFQLKTTGSNSYIYTGSKATDSRSILKMQRFVIPGTPIRDDNNNNPNPTVVMSSPKVTHAEEAGPIDFDVSTNPAVPELGPSYYFVRWTGKVMTTAHSPSTSNQVYKFKVTVNDGARLWVNGTLVIDSWTDKTTAASPTGTITLAPNTKYDIKLEYYQNKNTDGAVVKLYWSRTSGPAMAEVIIPKGNLYSPTATTANGLKGEYYTSAYTYIPGDGFSCVTDDDFLLPNEEKAGIGVNLAKLNSRTSYTKAVPFPIEMFDAREGLDNEFYGSNSPYRDTGAVPYMGVMSMIDIDVANLRSFLSGTWDGQFQSGLKSTDIPKDNGWVMYVSDRRGDRSFDGQLDMEDVYGPVKSDGSLDATHAGPNDGSLQFGEDVNFNGLLDADYNWEATKYRESLISDRAIDPVQMVQPTTTTTYRSANSDLAAIFDHKYYRRGVRLINGSRLPGDKNNGFTLASENGVYIFGNYNATGVASKGSPTDDTDYQPDSANGQVPASVVADAITVLSNPATAVGGTGWTDGTSFRKPDDGDFRLPKETTIRAALLMGNSISGMYNDQINQGGLYSQNLNGTISNFKRFLEKWGGTYLNYCGSLINLFNSQNNVGTFKYGGGTIYTAPTRNWVFDSSFLDATRLPPGTPFFQYVQMTGFRRMNN